MNLEQAMEIALRVEERNRVVRFKKSVLGSSKTSTYLSFIKGPTTSVYPGSLSLTYSPVSKSWTTGSGESQASVTGPKSSNSAKHYGEIKCLFDKELQEKRSKGLCFRCDAKWSIGHRCSKRELSILLMDDDDDDRADYNGTEAPLSPSTEV